MIAAGDKESLLLKLVTAIIILACSSSAALAQIDPRDSLMLIRMPDEAGLVSQPSDADIARFVASLGTYLHMSPQDLMRDRELARQVLGQTQIFEEVAQFQAKATMPVKVKFISWADAFRYFSDYVSDHSNPPIVAQLGDTWAAYFRSLGVMPYEQRHTWDVRLLWYWKDMVSPEEIADGDGFVAACQRLQAAPPPELTAPFVISTAPDWNLLHDLSIWLYSSGLPSPISTERKLGVLPWKEAVFAGPEGERAAQFLINLAKNGYVALPEKSSDQMVEDFLNRKYAMVILGSWVAREAAKKFGPDWESKIGATLPPKIGASVATTIKGGSLLVVLDPSRGKNAVGVVRAQRLAEFFGSVESQRRYTRILGALPANQQVLEESPYSNLFKTALDRGKTYPEIPEWAPVVENLATRDSLYAFWKRLSALADTHSTANQVEQSTREKLVLAALHSAQTDINKELSPGKLSFLWPWLLALIALLITVISASIWRRQIERRRIAELRQARDELYTLQRRNVPLKEALGESALPSSHEQPVAAKGYPAVYLDTVKGEVLLKKGPTEPLRALIHGAEYGLFRHIIECMQVGWHETHWIWSYIIWPTAHPRYPKEAYATHCTKLRKSVEDVWELGKLLGRGSRRGGAIPIEVTEAHFYTDAKAEGTAYSVWKLFYTSEEALKAFGAQRWEEARRHAEHLLLIDRDNWPGNMLLCRLFIQKLADADSPPVRQAIEFVHKQRALYQRAIEEIENITDGTVDKAQKERMLSRFEILKQITKELPPLEQEAQCPLERKPWRTRDQLVQWASYLQGKKLGLPSDETRIVQDVQRFVVRHLHWASPPEVQEHFRHLVQDLALDKTSWPLEKLPSSEKAFKYCALDCVLAALYHLSDDDESTANTKAQNLRKLWSRRAQLRKALGREPTGEELSKECQHCYGWSRPTFNQLLELETFCRPFPLDESHYRPEVRT